MKLRGLDIILTYECTGRCAHCCYRAGPGEGSIMTMAEVEGYLTAVTDHPIEWILLFGGEPFVCYDLLQASVATDPDTAGRLLVGLQEAGLDHMLFSVDAFHQEHVPVERIAIGIEAARELGYGRIEVDNRCLGEPDDDNAFNQRTQAIMTHLAKLCDLGQVTIYQGPSCMVGRAADALSPYLATQAGPWAECTLPGYFGGDLRAPTTVEIHPGGWVNLCAGLALGNAHEHPLDEILAGYNPDAHPIIGVLAREGPSGLLKLAQRHGYSPARGYVDGCHLCYQVRRFLRRYYPNHLAPAHPYTDA